MQPTAHHPFRRIHHQHAGERTDTSKTRHHARGGTGATHPTQLIRLTGSDTANDQIFPVSRDILRFVFRSVRSLGPA